MLASRDPTLQRAKEIMVPPPPGAPYSVALPGSEKPGRSKVYRHWRFTEGLLSTLDPNVTTVHEMFEYTANRQPTHRCLGHRPYHPVTKSFGDFVWQDYHTVQQRRAALGIGIVELHRSIGIMDKHYGVGLWCQNRPEWQLIDLACMAQALFSISIYDTLGPETTEYIINHGSLACVATSIAHIPNLLKLKPRLPSLKLIISLDSLDAGEQSGQSKADLLGPWASDLGVKLYSIDDVEALGRANPRTYNAPRPSDIITINYTSGTTGNPKGVILTHANAIAAASNGQVTVHQDHNDVHCSYLPLAHIYERVSQHCSLWGGAAIGFFHGNIIELVDDLKLLKPTAFISVPRLYNRFGSVIRAATTEQSGIKGALSRHIVSAKMANLTASDHPTNKHAIYDRIWGRKVASALGLERVRTMVSGSAPLDPSLQQFLRVVIGNNFIQGYGLTETYAVSLAQSLTDYTAGNCGAIAPCMEACLLDVPDMEYHSSDKPFPRGELLLRGAALFSGYFRNEAETKKAILSDGWFRTGDICTVDPMGRFTIVDRVKNVLKLAQGEYISPERIENVYLGNLSWLTQAYVHGDSMQTFLVAIFGINPELFAPFASRVLGRTIDPNDKPAMAVATAHTEVRKAVIKELDRIGKRDKFNSYEKVRNVQLMVDPFTIENELLTPTLKLKRPQTVKKHRADLDRLYAEALEEETVKARL